MAMSAGGSKHTSGYLVAPRVPQGLAAAVEGLTREVIRHRPEDIYVFAAHHFEKLLRVREKYGTTGIPLEQDTRTLRHMGLSHFASSETGEESARARENTERSGWSLNQTAKVLRRHRSIVGDSEEAFTIINPPGTHRSGESSRRSDQSIEDHRKASSKIHERSWSNDDHSTGDSEPRSAPKIISRISSTGMLAKDIKTELRKNRISSRERKSTKGKPEERRRVERIDASEKVEITKRSSSRKSSDRSRKSDDSELNRRKKKENGVESSGSRLTKTPSMDKVKDYVVHKFSNTKSIEELQSVDYVEKVQGIIDETGPIIKEKLDELKSEVFRETKSRLKLESKSSESPQSDEVNGLESRLNETKNVLQDISTSLSKPGHKSRSARILRRAQSIAMMSGEDFDIENPHKNDELMISALLIENGKKDGLDMRLSETKNILEDISTVMMKPKRRSQSAKGSHSSLNSDSEPQKEEDLEKMLNETRNLLVGISSSFQNGFRSSRGNGNGSSSSKSDESDYVESQNIPNVSLPAVRPPSAKGMNKNLVKNGPQEFILPAISPEAQKSTKRKEEFSLPILSPPGTSSSTEETKLPDSNNVFSKEIDVPDVPGEEVFKDSLNTTPEPTETPQRPDSLEPEELRELDQLQEPTSDLKEKLKEIQRVERSIEKVFDEENVEELTENNALQDPLKKKLAELVEVEKGIAEVLEKNELSKNSAEDATQSGESEGEKNFKQKENENNLLPESNIAVSIPSPEELSNTYILTEGSPYEIPDSVTTVIFPDYPKTPDSDRILNVEFENENKEDARLSLVPTIHMSIEELDETNDSLSFVKDPLESFGEVVLPDENPESLVELISPKPEIIIPKQNLQCIHEEEGLSGEDTPKNENLKTPKSALGNDGDNENLKSPSRLDSSDIISDFTGRECASVSSTSAKETSATDGPLGTPKPAENSGEVEEHSSGSRSAESTNEAKETTVTDGTSLSNDPLRPFVPELNLDSLQDITVSSFKMTEDEYEEPGENENTNSITETLTPDENAKISTADREIDELNSLEYCEVGKAMIIEPEATETEKEVSGELEKNNGLDQTSLETEEIVEDACIQKFVEIEEPPCEKKIVYNTEPNIIDPGVVLENPEVSLNSIGNNGDPQDKIFFDIQEELNEVHSEVKIITNEEETLGVDSEKGSESEDNFVDEDTPLAVSRSASQCTTRRVSSGHLARLKEEQPLDEDEEIETSGERYKEDSNPQQTPASPRRLEKDAILSDDVIVEGSNDFIKPVSPVGSLEDDLDGNINGESREYHIYVPEMDQSEESTTESSFNSAATKIQAGVRGFLTRRRLQRMHHLNSTLNGVPSIQDSIVMDENPLVLVEPAVELEDAAKTIQSNFRGYKARQRLRREDAMQRTTISMERAFAEDGIRHTGEFHDCVPLPLFDGMKNDGKNTPREFLTVQTDENPKDSLEWIDQGNGNLQNEVGMMFGISQGVPILQFGLNPKISALVDLVVLAKGESAVQSGYLNFITSVEDTEDVPVAQEFPSGSLNLGAPNSDISAESNQESVELSPRKGVIIEEITSLEAAEILNEIEQNSPTAPCASSETFSTDEVKSEPQGSNNDEKNPEDHPIGEKDEIDGLILIEDMKKDIKPEVDIIALNLKAPLSTLGFPMEQGKLLRYGSEDFAVFGERRPLLDVTLTPGDPMKSLSLSQESQLAGERIESPITMMQTVPVRSESLQQDDSSEIVSNDGGKNSVSSHSASMEDPIKLSVTQLQDQTEK